MSIQYADRTRKRKEEKIRRILCKETGLLGVKVERRPATPGTCSNGKKKRKRSCLRTDGFNENILTVIIIININSDGDGDAGCWREVEGRERVRTGALLSVVKPRPLSASAQSQLPVPFSETSAEIAES